MDEINENALKKVVGVLKGRERGLSLTSKGAFRFVEVCGSISDLAGMEGR